MTASGNLEFVPAARVAYNFAGVDGGGRRVRRLRSGAPFRWPGRAGASALWRSSIARGTGWDIEAGVGVGLTNASDRPHAQADSRRATSTNAAASRKNKSPSFLKGTMPITPTPEAVQHAFQLMTGHIVASAVNIAARLGHPDRARRGPPLRRRSRRRPRAPIRRCALPFVARARRRRGVYRRAIDRRSR